MDKPDVLWIDLREDRNDQHVHAELAHHCRLSLWQDSSTIPDEIAARHPEIICFEFDFPDPSRLRILQQTKQNFPSIPILMLTEQRSEELAIWALRARVWDYLIKPVESEELIRRVSMLASLGSVLNERAGRTLVQPRQQIAPNGKSPEIKVNNNVSRRAIAYLENHYHEKITLTGLAKQCGLSPHQFSRVFKREQTLTFRDFLIHYRIERACELLRDSAISIGDVAFAVGFGDHSYFTRTFKRSMGVSPTEYRYRHRPDHE